MNQASVQTTPPTAAVRSESSGIAITGAGGAFARSLLMQLRQTPDLRPTILCDRLPEAALAAASSLGYPADSLIVCTTSAQVSSAVSGGAIAVVPDIQLLDPACFGVLVEATGQVQVGVSATIAAIEAGRPVVLVSKETESLFGATLADRAAQHGVVCTTGAGDQPANLVSLINWATSLGLEVVAAGKSSEYDVIFDPSTGEVRHLDTQVSMPGLADLWSLGAEVSTTLAARTQLLSDLPLAAAADYCEMTVTANLTGFGVDRPTMHYPVVRTTELADVYALADDGGILQRAGVLDVFTALRTDQEASFAGGVFVVVRCHDHEVWQMLADKGHLVGRSGKYACIFHPFHLMGVETIGTIREVLRGQAVGRPQQNRVMMIARATSAHSTGERLRPAGHHHQIPGFDTEIVSTGPEAATLVPYYLAGCGSLARPVSAGDILQFDDLDLPNDLVMLWQANEAARSALT